MGTPAASISVAMKWRRSCRRKCGRPAPSRAAMNRLVNQFGSHGFVPSGRELNTNASAVSSPPTSRARSVAQSRCAISTPSVSASSSTRYVRWVLVERSSGPSDLHQCPSEGDRRSPLVDVAPPQGEQLTASANATVPLSALPTLV